MYVYTEKGEQEARKLGFTDRIAGGEAMLGHEPVSENYDTAKAWERAGLIEWKEEKNEAD